MAKAVEDKTVGEVVQDMDRKVVARAGEAAIMAQTYSQEDKVRVSISAMFRPYFGNVMPVILNGVPIYIPCDGRAYEIPASFAQEVFARLARVEAQIQRQQELGNATNNLESYPGERDLIHPVG